MIRVLFICFILIVSFPALAEIVIAHSDTNIDELSSHELRSIFLMRIKEWEDGTPIYVFVMKGNTDMHLEFSRNVLNLFPYQLQLAWDRQVFSGIGQYPNIVNSEQEMIEKVSTTPGAIGYSVNAQHENIRIIGVNNNE